MVYTPGHDALLYFKVDTGSINEHWDTQASATPTPAALPAIPAAPALVGYIEVPEVVDDDGTVQGYGGGSSYGLYDAKGLRQPNLTARLKVAAPDSVSFLQHCQRGGTGANQGNYWLADLALFSGALGSSGWMDVVRFAKCSQLRLTFQEGGGQEIAAEVQFEGMALQAGTPVTLTPAQALAQVRATGAVLTWHNMEVSLKTWDSTRGAVVATGEWRDLIAGASLVLNHSLERKGTRSYWGDSEPLSLTSYALFPHHLTVTGQLTFRQRLDATQMQRLAGLIYHNDVVFTCSSVPTSLGGGTTHLFTVTLQDVRTPRRIQRGGDTSQTISRTMDFTARDMAIVVVSP